MTESTAISPTVSLAMPEEEAAYLHGCYDGARIILEYGSGGSTELAARMPGKLVISVESDRDWARSLRRKIADAHPVSQVIIQHVYIGETGAWGRPVADDNWQNFHRYPNAIWAEPFFRHPDVILIDGRFRPACLMTAMLRITRPVTVLFDDYTDRPRYHLVEKLVRPSRLIGRMAEFQLQPGQIGSADVGFVISQFFEATFAGKGGASYALSPDEEKMLRQIRNGATEGPEG